MEENLFFPLFLDGEEKRKKKLLQKTKKKEGEMDE
jgi:hypothetical protein